MTDPAFTLPPEPDAYQRLLDAIHKARAHVIATDATIFSTTNTQAVDNLRDLCRLQLKALESGLFPLTEVPEPAAAIAAQQQGGRAAQADGCHCATCTCKPGMTPAVRFDTSPVEREGAVRDHLIRMGWTPPQQPEARVGGEVSYAECCDTPAYCSSVRRCTASDTPPPSAVPEGLTARDRCVLRLALHRFMGEAYARHNEASQKTTAGLYASGAAERFYRDAKDAERLLSVFAAKPRSV